MLLTVLVTNKAVAVAIRVALVLTERSTGIAFNTSHRWAPSALGVFQASCTAIVIRTLFGSTCCRFAKVPFAVTRSVAGYAGLGSCFITGNTTEEVTTPTALLRGSTRSTLKIDGAWVVGFTRIKVPWCRVRRVAALKTLPRPNVTTSHALVVAPTAVVIGRAATAIGMDGTCWTCVCGELSARVNLLLRGISNVRSQHTQTGDKAAWLPRDQSILDAVAHTTASGVSHAGTTVRVGETLHITVSDVPGITLLLLSSTEATVDAHFQTCSRG